MPSKIRITILLLLIFLIACQQSSSSVTQPQVSSATPQSFTENKSPEAPTPTDETLPTPSLTPPVPTPISNLPAVEELRNHLQGLDLETFFQVSFNALLTRSPEVILADGLEDVFGVEEPLLDDISQAYQFETHQMVTAILEMLSTYDRDTLPPTGQLSYDVYQWYLQDQLDAWEFRLYAYPATYFPHTSVHEDLLMLLADIHPIRDMQDARHYLARLGQVGSKIEQLIANLEESQQAGITPPRFAIQWAVYGSLGQFVDTPARQTSLYTTLQEKMAPLSSITPEDQQAVLDDAEGIITDQVLPAYKDLQIYLDGMTTYPGEDGGVWRLPQGDAYYVYQLRHFTSSDLTADEIHQLGLDELDRIHSEMRTVFEQLGYPSDLTIVQAYDRVAQEGGLVAGDQALTTFKNLITTAQERLGEAFTRLPKAQVIVVPDPYGDFYVRSSFDGSRPGAFYAGVGDTPKELYAMPTLAYHETVPGHHLQIALAQELTNLPGFRQGLTFTAFTEGWALYAEQLAWELGWYQDDPYGYLGLLQARAFRAARLVVDTGLHAQGWTFSQAQDFFTQNTGFEVGDNVNPQHQIARYLVWPGQSVSYYIGYLKIMELRQQAMDELGDQFDLMDFHRVVLENGSLPLQLLERVVHDYIQAKISG